jgi:hypothetical protein
MRHGLDRFSQRYLRAATYVRLPLALDETNGLVDGLVGCDASVPAIVETAEGVVVAAGRER